MTKWVCLDSQRLCRRTQVQVSIISNNSQLAWKWWRASCSKRQYSKKRIEELNITKSWSKGYLPRPRVSMQAKKRDMLWERNTWQAGCSQEPIRTYSNRVTSRMERSRITSSSLAQLTQKSNQITSLTARIPRLAQDRTNSLQILSYQWLSVEQTRPVLSQIVRIYSSVVTQILDLKSIPIMLMPNLSMPRVGRRTLALLEQRRGSLPRSIPNNQIGHMSQDRAAIQAKAYFRRSMQSKRWMANKSRSKASHRAATLLPLQQDHLTLNYRKTWNSIGLQLANTMIRDRLERQICKEELQITS